MKWYAFIARCALLFLPLILSAGEILAAPPTIDGKTETKQDERSVLVMLHLPAPHFRPDANYGGNYDGNRSGLRRIAEELAHEHGLTLISDWPMPVLNIDCFVMQVPVGETAAHMAEVLSKDPRTEWAQPLYQFQGMNGSDPLYRAQPSANAWHIHELHQVATGRNVKIAIIDSGVEQGHPDLNGQVTLAENFVDGNPYTAEIHGTAVAGIIAAHADNGIGIEGVAPDSHILALRACWQETAEATRCNSFTLGKALNFALMHDAQILNLSLSGPPDKLMQALVQAALARGVVVVAATDPARDELSFPASVPGVLAVASDATIGLPTSTILAPARDIPTTVPSGAYRFVSGTSYAAAHVSGMTALLLELKPSLSPAQIHAMLTPQSNNPNDTHFARSIDACATIATIAGHCSCSCPANNASKAFLHP